MPHYPLHAPKKDVEKYKSEYDQGWDVVRRLRYEKQIKSGLIPDRFKLSPRAAHIPSYGPSSRKVKKFGRQDGWKYLLL